MTVDDFDFTYQSTVKLSLLGSALSPDFVTDGRSLILHGKPGRGKTHIAVAIGYRAIQNGFDTLFVTAAELIEDLSVASREGRLADALTRYITPHVLVCDEVADRAGQGQRRLRRGGSGRGADRRLDLVVGDRRRAGRAGGLPPTAAARRALRQRPMADVFDVRSSGHWSFSAEASTVLRDTGLAHEIGLRFAQGRTLRPKHDARYWAAVTSKFDFSDADRVPPDKFNRVLWTCLMAGKRYPKVASRFAHRDPDDDD